VRVGDLLDLMLLLVFGRIALEDDAAGGDGSRDASSGSKLPNAGIRP
jgi:hypothetical protein